MEAGGFGKPSSAADGGEKHRQFRHPFLAEMFDGADDRVTWALLSGAAASAAD
jgi:hypothetical protein